MVTLAGTVSRLAVAGGETHRQVELKAAGMLTVP